MKCEKEKYITITDSRCPKCSNTIHSNEEVYAFYLVSKNPNIDGIIIGKICIKCWDNLIKGD